MWKGRSVEGLWWSRVTVFSDRVRDVSHVEHGDCFVLWHRQPGKNTGVTAHLTCWDVAYTRRGPLVPTVEPVKRPMPETSCTETWESCTGSFVVLIDFTNFSSFFLCCMLLKSHLFCFLNFCSSDIGLLTSCQRHVTWESFPPDYEDIGVVVSRLKTF